VQPQGDIRAGVPHPLPCRQQSLTSISYSADMAAEQGGDVFDRQTCT
jgi:hypothetical protein